MVTDGGIQFPPGQRRDKPSFEPPPWERDQFDELARRKQDEAQPPAVESGPSTGAGQAAGAEPAPVAELSQPGPAVEGLPEGTLAGEPAAPAERELDAKQVEVLLMGLRAEEPRPEKMYLKVVAGSGVVSILIGLMIGTWAIVVISTPKEVVGAEVLFEVMLLLAGLGFIAGGAWVVFKSLRQQGVL